MKVLVLCVKPPYDFTDDSGRRIAGFKVVYVPVGVPVSNSNHKGLLVIEKSFPTSSYNHFKTVPAFYDFAVMQGYTSKGAPYEVINSVSFESNASLDQLIDVFSE